MATLLYRIFKIGRIPPKVRPVLEAEGIVVAVEGIGGWLINRNFKSPTRRCLYRKRSFTGCLVLTEKRLLCYTYARRQINIALDDPRFLQLKIELLQPNVLSVAFEASVFRDDCRGGVEFRFHTPQAKSIFKQLEKGSTRSAGPPPGAGG